MCRFGNFVVVLLSWSCNVGLAERAESPRTVSDLLSSRIDSVIREKHTLKSELIETQAVLENIEQKSNHIDANMTLMSSKSDIFEGKKSRYLLTQKDKVIKEASKQFVREKLKTMLARKMLIIEKSYMRKAVLTKLNDSDNEMKQIGRVLIGNIRTINHRLSTVDPNMASAKTELNDRLDIADTQLRKMSSKLVICDDDCKVNGGKCIGSGECECPLGKFGNNCEQSGCKLPEVKNNVEFENRKHLFTPGEQIEDLKCEPDYILSSNNKMTCQSDGSWSEEIECVKGVHYVISARTGYMMNARSTANVYITLFGAGGMTRKIPFVGRFEYEGVDEIRVMAEDIRPIQLVLIGHDGSGMFPDWYIDYVSIIVENMDEYYTFRNTEDQWVKADNDLILFKTGNDSCVGSFGRELPWFPNLSKIFQTGSQ